MLQVAATTALAQWKTLGGLSSKLSDVAAKPQEKIRAVKRSRTQRRWQGKRETHVSCAVGKGRHFRKGTFATVSSLQEKYFHDPLGPRSWKSGSEEMKLWKECAHRKCEMSPDRIISWAVAYAPTLWAGGSMSSEVFDCLVDYMEPELIQP